MQSASGVGGAGLNVEEVFSTYLYDGTGSSLTIDNGIDLDGEGGMVWIKGRIQYSDHFVYDTERGAGKNIRTNKTLAQGTRTDDLTAFNSNGFSLSDYSEVNTNYSSGGVGYNYASWTFRKAEKFFDVVTYTGNGNSARAIAHSIGGTVGSVIIKKLDSTEAWYVWHRGYSSGSLKLNETSAGLSFGLNQYFGGTQPTSSNFYVSSDSGVNNNGSTYVAYLFAHNNNDGEFGPDADADIIKCGSYTNSGSAWSVDLGFEPQWLLRKLTDGIGSWQLTDNMRGLLADNGSGTAYARLLKAESSNPENNAAGINITSTGIEGTGAGDNGTYIYIAIRRGTKVPESATEVFAMDYQGNGTTNPAYVSGFVTDFGLRYYLPGGSSAYPISGSRLTGTNRLTTSSTSAQVSQSSLTWDYMNGWYNPDSNSTNVFTHMWKRAPNYFDVVAYTGTGSNRTVAHNLGVAPKMIWIKGRSAAYDWVVYHEAIGNSKILNLNGTVAGYTQANFNNTDPTSSVFTVGSIAGTNASSQTFIAYLFATLDGISKVGSYTGNGSTLNIDCGFTSGARFVLIKSVSTSGSWYVLDTERGIVAGNDPVLSLNTTDAEESFDDLIDPYSAGFTLNGVGMVNANNVEYIFYAIA